MANGFTITLPSLKTFQNKYDQAPKRTVEILSKAMKEAAIAVQAIARSEAPVRTGKLRASIDFEVDGLMARVYPDLRVVPYAVYVHGGTGLYGQYHTPVIPKRAKVLATKVNPGWGKASNGYFIIGRSTKGQKANPFMERARKSGDVAVKRIFADNRKQLIAELRING